MRPVALGCALLLLLATACGVSIMDGTPAASIAGFPEQLLSFSGGAAPLIEPGGASWDAHGTGAPSNVIYLRGEYWMCYSGYPTSAMSAQSIGCAHGAAVPAMIPYAENPVMTSSAPGWAAACIEGPALFVSGDTVYMLFNGYPSQCDSRGTGNIGMVSTSVNEFPNGWSAMAAAPLIQRPPQMRWLYRPSVVESNGTFYDFSNGGDADGHDIIGTFSAPAITGPWTYLGTALTTSQPWEVGGELQDPQVWLGANGLWMMVFGGIAHAPRVGLAVSHNLTSWEQLADNPVSVEGTPSPYLPRVVLDQDGNYWMLTGANNIAGRGIYLDQAVGRSSH